MSDLRDRIAAAIKNRWRDMSMEETWDEGTLLLADAVIAELNLAKACQSGCVWQIPNRVEDMTPQQRELLGLRQETSYGTTYPSVPVTDVTYVRYATDWRTE